MRAWNNHGHDIMEHAGKIARRSKRVKHQTSYKPGKYIFTNRHGAKTPMIVKDNGLAYGIRWDGRFAPLGITLDQLKRDGDTVTPATDQEVHDLLKES